MPQQILSDLDFVTTSRLLNLPPPDAASEPVRKIDLETELNTRRLKQTTLNLPSGSGVIEWIETIPDAEVIAGQFIQASLSPAIDDDENDPELLDFVSIAALAGNGEVTITITFSELTSGPIKVLYGS